MDNGALVLSFGSKYDAIIDNRINVELDNNTFIFTALTAKNIGKPPNL